MRPLLKFLSDSLVEQIITEARDILCQLGVTIYNPPVVDLLASHGAKVDVDRIQVIFNQEIIDKALKTSPSAFKLFDIYGNEAVDLSGNTTNFTPGSAALNILDNDSGTMRKPTTTDYVNYVKLVEQTNNIASQSTCMIPSDVPENVSDSYRLYLSLMFGTKPVVTGTFTIDAFEVMKNMQLAIRGDEASLAERPLTIFSCCPTSPLKWSDITSQNVIDCGRYGIPIEFISMPLSGFMAPVTLVGTLIQHTAETLSGIVISQLANPGAPMLYGGSPATFDIRHETTPMGAVETQMIDCAYNEIGKYLGLPTQAYIGLSDAKLLDAQAGLETSMGATLAALAGINNVSGPGMLDFESCFSLEKLVVDNEICGMTLRMVRGIEPRDDFPSLGRMQELLSDGHLLISDHTRKHLKDEHYFPGPAIDRANHSRWMEEGAKTIGQRATSEVNRMIANYQPSDLPEDCKKELSNLMQAEASQQGMSELPEIEYA